MLPELCHWSRNRIKYILACAAEFIVQYIDFQLDDHNMLKLVGICIALVHCFIINQRQKTISGPRLPKHVMYLLYRVKFLFPCPK